MVSTSYAAPATHSQNFFYKQVDAFSMDISMKNKKGDSVELSIDAVRMQTLHLQSNSENAQVSAKELMSALQDSVEEMHQRVVEKILEEFLGDKVESKPEKLQIDPYWNAENTSQRIVDFATQFAAQFGADSQFFQTIKGAVEEGFTQAKEMLGNLGGEVGELVEQTYTLTMEKLDQWAQQQGIEVAESLRV